MNRLPSVIGPAPSELSFESFREKLSHERDRVRESLEEFRLRGRRPKGRKPPKSSITATLKATGLSKEEFLKGLELLQKMEREKKGGEK